MIVMPVFREPPPAGSDSGLRPPQGQSRFWESIFLLLLSYDPTCSNFHFYCNSHNWLNIIYERATQSKFLPEGPLLLILENIYVNELPNSNLQ